VVAAHRVPVVVTVHEYWPASSWSPRRAVLRWQNRRRLAAVLGAASAVVVTQDIYARGLRDAGVCDGKAVHVIPAGSNITRVAAAGPRTGGLLLFGQPASFQPTHLAALAAWLAAGIDRPPLTWIGRSRDELRRAWSDAARGASDAVTLVGGATEAAVSALLSQATVGLAPYANGASGRRTTLAALLQHGVPTVATVGIATEPWLTETSGLRTVTGNEPRAYLAAVEALLRDAGERDQLSRNAETLFSARLAWPHLAEQYRTVMRDAR
jgi:glycosyltransferase involved in cell wall biosynthesis